MSAGLLEPLPIEVDSIPRERQFRYTLEKYHRMIAAGAFDPEERCELIDGSLVKSMPQSSGHSHSVGRSARWFNRRLDDPWVVGSQTPITLAPHEPEPDCWISRSDRRPARGQHPGPAEVALVVEVAESSLAFDRGRKRRLYAAAGIPEYWIVNLADRQVEVHRRPIPAENRYAEVETVSADGSVKVVLDGSEFGSLPLSELLP